MILRISAGRSKKRKIYSPSSQPGVAFVEGWAADMVVVSDEGSRVSPASTFSRGLECLEMSSGGLRMTA